MGFKIGVANPPEGGSPFWVEKKARAKFEQVDVIVYGHSHRPKSKVIQAILHFNPGSIAGKFPAKHKTYGVLTVGEEVNGKIMKL